MPSFSVIALATEEGGVAFTGRVPDSLWLAHWAHRDQLTQVDAGSVVIMGRQTWEELPQQPLRRRINVVISSTMEEDIREAVVCRSLDAALQEFPESPAIFVIGGARLFQEALQHPDCSRVFVTRLDAPKIEVSRTVPELTADHLLDRFQSNGCTVPVVIPSDLSYYFVTYCTPAPFLVAARHEEQQYLDLVRLVLAKGERRHDRTGTGVYSLFAPPPHRFSLRDGRLPLLTTKHVPLRAVFEELMFFIRGQTDGRVLLQKGVHIWEKNGSRSALDALGFTDRAEHDLGPIYGRQWRHFGAPYVNAKTEYAGEGVDQLALLINGLRRDPIGRRHLLTAWNPAQLSIMALPPCHFACQFYVSNGGELSCQLYQRSADLGLGLPFNMASYGLFTQLLASVCCMTAGDLIVVLGDAHIYRNHEPALRIQLTRTPQDFPTVHFQRPPTSLEELEQMQWSDLELVDYRPHPKIPMEMSV